MAASPWMQPEDFLRTWTRGAPSARSARGESNARARLKQREGFAAAVMLLGIARLTGSRWLFSLPEDDPPDALAVRSACDGKPLRMPIEVIGIPAHAVGNITEAGEAGGLERQLLNFLRAKKLDTKRYIPGTILCVHLDLTDHTWCPDTLAGLIGEHAGTFAEIWLLTEAGSDDERFHVHQIYPQRGSTLVDLAVLDTGNVVA